MKFTTVFALVAVVTAVSASTNGERLARGLGPMTPSRRGTRVAEAHHGKPSGTPGKCNNGNVHCCNSLQKTHEGNPCDDLLKHLNIYDEVQPGTTVGLNCSPITLLGAGSGAHCTQQTVCCENDHFNGLINIGCNNINL